MVTVRKYEPLGRLLNALPPEQTRARLSFAAIEAIVGPLPASAWMTHFWTTLLAPPRTREVYAFRGRLNRADRSVTFTRQPCASDPPISPQAAVQPRRDGTGRGLPVTALATAASA